MLSTSHLLHLVDFPMKLPLQICIYPNFCRCCRVSITLAWNPPPPVFHHLGHITGELFEPTCITNTRHLECTQYWNSFDIFRFSMCDFIPIMNILVDVKVLKQNPSFIHFGQRKYQLNTQLMRSWLENISVSKKL